MKRAGFWRYEAAGYLVAGEELPLSFPGWTDSRGSIVDHTDPKGRAAITLIHG
jgi:hypothetical protein